MVSLKVLTMAAAVVLASSLPYQGEGKKGGGLTGGGTHGRGGDRRGGYSGAIVQSGGGDGSDGYGSGNGQGERGGGGGGNSRRSGKRRGGGGGGGGGGGYVSGNGQSGSSGGGGGYSRGSGSDRYVGGRSSRGGRNGYIRHRKNSRNQIPGQGGITGGLPASNGLNGQISNLKVFTKAINVAKNTVAAKVFQELSLLKAPVNTLEETNEVYFKTVYGISLMLDAWIPGLGECLNNMNIVMAKAAFCGKDSKRLAPNFNSLGWPRPVLCTPVWGSQWKFLGYSGSDETQDLVAFYKVQSYFTKIQALIRGANGGKDFNAGTPKVIATALLNMAKIFLRDPITWSRVEVIDTFKQTVTIMGAIASGYNVNMGRYIVKHYMSIYTPVAIQMKWDLYACYRHIRLTLRECTYYNFGGAINGPRQFRWNFDQQPDGSLQIFGRVARIFEGKESKQIKMALKAISKSNPEVTSIDQAFYEFLTLSRVYQPIGNRWVKRNNEISGCGTTYLRLVRAIIQYTACNENGAIYQKIQQKGLSKPKICSPTYGRKWGWPRFSGEYTLQNIIQYNKLQNIRSRLEAQMKAITQNKGFTNVNENKMYQLLYNTASLFEKDSWNDNDVKLAYFGLPKMMGYIGSSYHPEMGKKIVTVWFKHYSDFNKQFGFDNDSELKFTLTDISQCIKHDLGGFLQKAKDEEFQKITNIARSVTGGTNTLGTGGLLGGGGTSGGAQSGVVTKNKDQDNSEGNDTNGDLNDDDYDDDDDDDDDDDSDNGGTNDGNNGSGGNNGDDGKNRNGANNSNSGNDDKNGKKDGGKVDASDNDTAEDDEYYNYDDYDSENQGDVDNNDGNDDGDSDNDDENDNNNDDSTESKDDKKSGKSRSSSGSQTDDNDDDDDDDDDDNDDDVRGNKNKSSNGDDNDDENDSEKRRKDRKKTKSVTTSTTTTTILKHRRGLRILRQLSEACKSSKARKIYKDLSKKKRPARNIDEGFKVLFKSSRGFRYIGNKWQDGYGDLVDNMLAAFARVQSCTKNGAIAKKFKSKGWGKPKICKPDYGSSWGWKKYGGIRRASASQILDHYGVKNAWAKIQKMFKGKTDLTDTEKVCKESSETIAKYFEKQPSQWTEKDFIKVISAVSISYGAVASGYNTKLGPYVALAMFRYYKPIAKKLDIETDTYENSITTSMSKCTTTTNFGSTLTTSKKQFEVSQDTTADVEDDDDDDEDDDDNSNEGNTRRSGRRCMRRNKGGKGRRNDDDNDDDDDDERVKRQEKTRSKNKRKNDDDDDDDDDGQKIKRKQRGKKSRKNNQSNDGSVDGDSDYDDNGDDDDDDDDDDSQKNKRKQRGKKSRRNNQSNNRSVDEDSDNNDNGDDDDDDDDDGQKIKKKQRGKKSRRNNQYDNRSEDGDSGYDDEDDDDDDDYYGDDDYEYDDDKGRSNGKKTRKGKTRDDDDDNDDDDDKSRPNAKKPRRRENDDSDDGDDDDNRNTENTVRRGDKAQKPRKNKQSDVSTQNSYILKHYQAGSLRVLRTLSYALSSKAEEIRRNLVYLSRRREPAATYDEGLDVLVRFVKIVNIVGDKVVNGLGDFYRKMTLEVLRTVSCLSDGILYKKNKSKGWTEPRLCNPLYGVKWGWKKYEGSFSNRQEITKFYNVKSAWSTVQNKLKKRNLQGNQKLLYQFISKTYSDVYKKGANQWKIEDIHTLIRYLGSAIGTIAGGHHPKTIEYVARAYASQFSNFGLDSTTYTNYIKQDTSKCTYDNFNGLVTKAKQDYKEKTDDTNGDDDDELNGDDGGSNDDDDDYDDDDGSGATWTGGSRSKSGSGRGGESRADQSNGESDSSGSGGSRTSGGGASNGAGSSSGATRTGGGRSKSGSGRGGKSRADQSSKESESSGSSGGGTSGGGANKDQSNSGGDRSGGGGGGASSGVDRSSGTSNGGGNNDQSNGGGDRSGEKTIVNRSGQGSGSKTAYTAGEASSSNSKDSSGNEKQDSHQAMVQGQKQQMQVQQNQDMYHQSAQGTEESHQMRNQQQYQQGQAASSSDQHLERNADGSMQGRSVQQQQQSMSAGKHDEGASMMRTQNSDGSMSMQQKKFSSTSETQQQSYSFKDSEFSMSPMQ